MDINFQHINTFLLTLAALASAYAAVRQTQINKRLKSLNDFVAVAAAPENMYIKIHNVGKVNLYLHAYSYGISLHKYPEGRLLSIGTADLVFYWLPAPAWNIFQNGKIEMTLFLIDEFGKKFTARFGGEITQGDEQNFHYNLWSLRTEEKNWSI